MSATEHRLLGYLSLFTSFGTLVCCALPALLVLAGLGTTVGAILNAAPWLVSVSRQRAWVFGGAGSVIAASFVYVYWLAPRLKARGEGCTPGVVSACSRAERFSRGMLWLSAALYGAGLFVAYLLVPLLLLFE